MSNYKIITGRPTVKLRDNHEDWDAIIVWRWEDAPDQYKALSQHGGDEDWVAFVPDYLRDKGNQAWMESGSPFGCCDVSEHEVEGGVVRIGAHA